jgi:predicted enzyme related to lactoylglutathione lyase
VVVSCRCIGSVRAARPERSGGTVVTAPSDAGTAGRFAICTDPAGAGFGSGRRAGDEHAGCWNFSDLHTPDRDAAMAFYTTVFGWRAAGLEQGVGTMLQVSGYGDHLAATVDPSIYDGRARRRRVSPTCPPGPMMASLIGYGSRSPLAGHRR